MSVAPATDDLFLLVDISDTTDAPTGTTKKLTWANIKSFLKTYMDTLYMALVAPSTSGNVLTSNGTNWTSATPAAGVTKASAAEIAAGTDDAKFATALAIKNSNNVPNVVPSTSGNVLTSDGTNWVANPPANRNAIINGAMDIWQRGTATLTNPASATYFPDRFKIQHVLGDGTFNLLQSTETPAATFPFQFSLQHDTTAVETAVAAGEYSVLRYNMEGYDFKKFEGNIATLSFWVKSVKTGIFCVAFRNNAANKSYVQEFTINATNTWEKKTVTLTFNSGGTFLYTTDIGLIITWAVMCGSSQQTATANKGTWIAGSYIATDAQVNGMDNAANNFYLTGVQLELGSVATPFEQRPFATELALCKRYCYGITTDAITRALGIGWAESTTVAHILIPNTTEMRTTPTLTATATDWQLLDFVGAATDITALAIQSTLSSSKYISLQATAASGLTQYRNYALISDAARVLILSAEL